MSTVNQNPERDRSRYLLIRQAVLVAGTSFAEIARRAHVSPSMITYVASGRRVSKRVRRALASAVGMRYRQLWG